MTALVLILPLLLIAWWAIGGFRPSRVGSCIAYGSATVACLFMMLIGSCAFTEYRVHLRQSALVAKYQPACDEVVTQAMTPRQAIEYLSATLPGEPTFRVNSSRAADVDPHLVDPPSELDRAREIYTHIRIPSFDPYGRSFSAAIQFRDGLAVRYELNVDDDVVDSKQRPVIQPGGS